MKIRFVKMHGLGNDFILIDCLGQELGIRNSDLGDLSRQLCNRRFGIGADQLLLLYPSTAADFKMRIFNADGSEVEMCGNGIRCLAKYIWDRGYSDKMVLAIETPAGIVMPERIDGLIRVDMGRPFLEVERIPVNIPHCPPELIDYPIQIEGREFKITCVSMGNPHTIIVVDNLSDFPVPYYGPIIENHPIFPQRTNVEFIEVMNPSEIKMRVWERGAGETMACGTGASAAAVASHLKGLTEKKVTVHLPGGDLFIEWKDDNHVLMAGPAVEVFAGEIDITATVNREP
jgi:diaminopimelate epimerase